MISFGIAPPYGTRLESITTSKFFFNTNIQKNFIVDFILKMLSHVVFMDV